MRNKVKFVVCKYSRVTKRRGSIDFERTQQENFLLNSDDLGSGRKRVKERRVKNHRNLQFLLFLEEI